MPTRYHIAPIIGDGLTPETAYRAQITNAAFQNFGVYIPSKADGTPRANWCLVDITALDQTPFINDPNLRALPNITLDTAINASQANSINTVLANHMASPPTVSAGQNLRQVIGTIRGALDNS